MARIQVPIRPLTRDAFKPYRRRGRRWRTAATTPSTRAGRSATPIWRGSICCDKGGAPNLGIVRAEPRPMPLRF